MLKENQKIKYFIYVRKSQEAEDRQVQSIDDQFAKLKEIVKRFDLKVVDVFKESKSAKDPGNRPLFEKMMERIENGDADGILCWELNRLSRNPLDSGKISLYLRDGTIKSIRTYTREYRTEDNVLLYNVETGMADQFVRDLKRNTKRGLESKVNKGWFPSVAPTGYVNDIPTRTIKVDEERFNLVRKMWDMMLSGNFTAPQIASIMNEKGFRTRRGKKHGGKPLSNSSIYRIFTNLFYTGNFSYKGVEYKGNHKPMITLKEFDKVQFLLGRKGRPRPKSHEFAYTGMIKCGECGCFVTAEEKKKLIKGTGEIATYVYYRCSKKKRNHKCKQPSITLGDIEEQISREISKFTIYPEFRDWAIKKIKEANDSEINTRFQEYELLQKTYADIQSKIDNLTRMRYSDFITDDEFIKERTNLRNERAKLKQNLDQNHNRARNWEDLTERAFHFASNAKEKFDKGNLQRKKEVLAALGSNFVLKDKKLHLEPVFWLEPIVQNKEKIDAEVGRLELAESGKDLNKKGNGDILESTIPVWGR